jgi:hypothetical protein
LLFLLYGRLLASPAAALPLLLLLPPNDFTT